VAIEATVFDKKDVIIDDSGEQKHISRRKDDCHSSIGNVFNPAALFTASQALQTCRYWLPEGINILDIGRRVATKLHILADGWQQGFTCVCRQMAVKARTLAV
jgi:hypothetical protein